MTGGASLIFFERLRAARVQQSPSTLIMQDRGSAGAPGR